MHLLTCNDAMDLVCAHTVRVPEQEDVPLQAALGRVLAQSVFADRDQPPFPRSTRDGYAMRSADSGAPLKLAGAIRAGEQWTGAPLAAGEAIEIMTGAPVPAGADAVVMLEHVALDAACITLQNGRRLSPGENIVPQAAEAAAGDSLLRTGTRLGAAEIALCASVGAASLRVFRRPVAAILATGDELVAVDAEPDTMQIRNSNSHALAALVESNGGVTRILPPAADTKDALLAAIQSARDTDILLITGGVSAGRYDFVEEVIESLGGRFFFTGVAMQPGKPAVFGELPAIDKRGPQCFFGLPGNPVSTQVTATLFAMPMLRALGGEAQAQPLFALARLAVPVNVRPGLTRFLPARLTSDLAGVTVEPTGWQGSGDLNANARANCYLVVPPDAAELPDGTVVTVLLR